MDQITTKTLEDIAEKVERASKQKPELNPDAFFTSTLNFAKKAEMDEPEWGRVRGGWIDNRTRDEWLSALVQQEPHLASVLSTAVTLDANRRYRLIGGRNQVLRYSRRFDTFQNGQGFRTLQELAAKDYYNADVGAIYEIETDGRNGPLLSLYHVDPSRVRLGKEGLLKYDNDIWQPDSYFRLASQKSTFDKYNLLGFSAVSRCLKLAQTMIALVTHNLEKLGYLAPNGILFVSAEDITQDMWDEAVEARKAVYITNTGNQYYDQMMTIFDRNISADLVEFSKMPEKFDTFMFTDYMLKGYSLAFNRDVRTFWSLNSGNFGGGTEAALQDEKATYAGAAEFILAMQDKLQRLLPSSVLFEYEVEDTRGKLQKAEVENMIIDSATKLLDLGLDQERVFSWLAERGVIPPEWSLEEEATVAEMGIVKERYLETEMVQRAIQYYPDEPIVMYESSDISHPHGRIRQLWKSGDDAVRRSWLVAVNWGEIKRSKNDANENIDPQEYPYIPKDEMRSWQAQFSDSPIKNIERIKRKLELRNQAHMRITRQLDIEDYEEGDDYSVGDYMYAAGAYNYLDQVDSPDEEEVAAAALALAMIRGDEPMDTNRLESLLKVVLPALVLAYLLDLRRYSDDAEEGAYSLHPERWNSRLGLMTQYGILYGADDLDTERTWTIGKTENHCSDCLELDGQTKTVAEWIEDGRLPQSSILSCQGWNCDCSLV